MTAEIERIAFEALGGRWGGNVTVPQPSKSFEFGESWPDYATVLNDGFELWIGTGEKWHTNMNRQDARRLAWWILWDWWIKAEWFGLRRRVWYALLKRRVARYKR